MSPVIPAAVVIALSASYTLALLALSRRADAPTGRAPDHMLVVFVVPCLDEARVIEATLDRLLAFDAASTRILVVDDGSSDGTAERARRRGGSRVWVLERVLPDARQGKGEALNAAYRWLRRRPAFRWRGHERVVLCVLDADGRLASNALDVVLPEFADPTVAGVQVDVRMHNRDRSLLTRLQDIEFVVFGDVFQRGRESLGSAGLGGNGQFVRLSALTPLGDSPWSDCLTEDLDLGVRLLIDGWRHRHCTDTHVDQQAVPTLHRLVRQRARWFQGHVQCMRLIPRVMGAPELGTLPSFDLIYHLTSPVLVLLTSVATAAFLGGIVVLSARGAFVADAIAPSPVALGLTYLLAFGMAPVIAALYRRREPGIGRIRALWWGHVYALYAGVWFVAGWAAVARLVSRRRRWAKTEREVDVPSTRGAESPSLAA